VKETNVVTKSFKQTKLKIAFTENNSIEKYSEIKKHLHSNKNLHPNVNRETFSECKKKRYVKQIGKEFLDLV